MPMLARRLRRCAAMFGRVSAAICLLFVIANVTMAQVYRNRALPQTYLGKLDISGKPLAALGRIPAADILPAGLILQRGGTQVNLTPVQLGMDVDVAASVPSSDSLRRWIPLISLAGRYDVPLRLRFAPAVYQRTTASLATAFTNPAVPQHIVLNGSAFAIAPAAAGYTLDGANLAGALAAGMRNGASAIRVPVKPIAAPASGAGLTGELARLQRHLGVTIRFVYRSQTIQPGRADIGRWFVPNGQSMALSHEATRAYIDKLGRQLGVAIANPDDLATAAAYAAGKDLTRSFAVTPAGNDTAVRTYCTAVRDVDDAVLADLTGKLAATYNDVRGWNNGGRIAFEHADSGCQYTVWMSAPAQMSSFGAICDAYYSCQAGTNVVLNHDRWTAATDPWHAANGTMEDYRTLMIDHETGHRLGFLDNPACPGRGQPAPVMMQQSIDLKGCIFNIWPLQAEFAQLDTMLGLPAPSSAASE